MNRAERRSKRKEGDNVALSFLHHAGSVSAA
jgi:hypothetical protein